VTAGQKARYEELHTEWMVYQKEMEQLMNKDVADFNALCRTLSIANVILPE
jgi:hypothetical protein